MPTILKAESYDPHRLGSLGDASYMLLRQHQYPVNEYGPPDLLTSADHDRCQMWDYDHFNRCCKEYVGRGDLAIGQWSREVDIKRLMEFLVDVLKADEHHPGVVWTGCRVTGTVNRSNGYPVWSLELFSLGKGSTTKVEDHPSYFRKRGSVMYW